VEWIGTPSTGTFPTGIHTFPPSVGEKIPADHGSGPVSTYIREVRIVDFPSVLEGYYHSTWQNEMQIAADLPIQDQIFVGDPRGKSDQMRLPARDRNFCRNAKKRSGVGTVPAVT